MVKFTDIVFVVACNNEKTYFDNLFQTNIGDRLIIMRGYNNICKAYNKALETITSPYIVLLHQDIWFDESWIKKLTSDIDMVNKLDPDWGVLGVAGVIYLDKKYIRGHIKDRNNEWGSPIKEPQEVQTIDELLMVVKSSDNIIFDENLLNHFYTADVCLAMNEICRQNYVIPAYLEHRAFQNTGVRDENFYNSEKYILEKYKIRPLLTTCSSNF